MGSNPHALAALARYSASAGSSSISSNRGCVINSSLPIGGVGSNNAPDKISQRLFNRVFDKVPIWRSLRRSEAIFGMFADIIRRKFSGQSLTSSDAAFESTTVSLSTAVPRPAERRGEERLSAMLRVGKLTSADGSEQLVKIKNLSAGGVMAIVPREPKVGEEVKIELSSQQIPATVVWIREGTAGLKFDQNIDLASCSPGRKPRHGFRARPPAARNPVQGLGAGRQDLLHRRRARHFARRHQGSADRGILRRQEGRRRGREPSSDQRRGPLVFRAPRRHRV